MSRTNSLMAIIPESVQIGIDRFDEIFYESLESISPTLVRAIDLLRKGEGKRIRPILLLLVGGAFGSIDEKLINGSVFIEMFHLSTLIHDDVVDDSYQRRGVPSMNSVFGNRKAVIIGDYVLASAMAQAMYADDKEVIKQLISLGKQLSEGEIYQMDIAELGSYTEENYFKVVEQKTSSLISTSMYVGAILSGVKDEQIINKLREAGRLLGIAFQIRDDIFDFLPTKTLGKPSGQDISEHKITLPLIYALNKENKEVVKVQKLLRHREFQRNEIDYIIDFTIRMGGIEYAERKMNHLIDKAKEILYDIIPEGENKDALLNIADYIGSRNR